jgi:hypothetical protein
MLKAALIFGFFGSYYWTYKKKEEEKIKIQNKELPNKI